MRRPGRTGWRRSSRREEVRGEVREVGDGGGGEREEEKKKRRRRG